jgi:hypothetical protein
MPKYNHRDTAEVAEFFESFRQESVNAQGVFDSAAADSFFSNALNQATGVKVPAKLQAVLDETDAKGAGLLARALLDGADSYERDHGAPCPADLVQQAIHMAYANTREARRRMGMSLDDATSESSDPLSLQANRTIVAILTAMSEAIPFAHYLPADINSNEARLAIMTHQAGSDFGRYAQGDLLDGASAGDTYISSSREHECAIVVDGSGDPTGQITGLITARQLDDEKCDPSAPPVKLLRGRAIVYIDGQIAAREVSASGSGASAVSGSMAVGGIHHQIAGSIHPDTGAIDLTATPPLPPSAKVVVEAFVDYEHAADLTPKIITAVELFSLHAKPWRVITTQTIDARTQMANELGLDPYSEGVMAIQSQFANERHYEVLRKARRLAQRNTETFDFNWMPRSDTRSRAHVWMDFPAVIGVVSQRMALTTMNHGVTHLYVGEIIASQLQGLPSDIWQPSGVMERPGIFRLGRLFGRYEVYYTPKVVREGTNSAEILCIGRATDVTRNPFVLGDAVPPTVIPLSTNADLKSGAGFYARNFTCVNPHAPSATGCAMINVTNLFTN